MDRTIPTTSAWLILGFVAACGVLLFVVLVARLTFYYQQRKLKHRQSVIAEYEAPNRLAPAELGYVFDRVFGKNELLATIVKLYQGGIVKLVRIGQNDFMLTALDDSQLGAFHPDDIEAALLGYMRGLPGAQAKWSELSSPSSDAFGNISDLEDATLESLSGKGFLQTGIFGSMLLRKRKTSIILATFISITLLMPLYLRLRHNLATTGLGGGFGSLDREISTFIFIPFAIFVWVLSYAYGNAAAYLYYAKAGIPVGATPELERSWPDIAGFRLFLQVTEFQRLQSDMEPADPLLPYCLALGLDPGFIKSLPS